MNMGGYNYSLGGSISTLLYLIIKLMIVVLAVVIVLGVIVWVRDNLFKNDSSKIVKDIKNDPLLKVVTVITLAIVGIVFLFAIINGILNPGVSGSMGNGMEHQGGYIGYNPMYGISGILFLLIRALMFILVISLVLAGLTYLKDLYENGKLNVFDTSNKKNSIITDIDNTSNFDKNSELK